MWTSLCPVHRIPRFEHEHTLLLPILIRFCFLATVQSNPFRLRLEKKYSIDVLDTLA